AMIGSLVGVNQIPFREVYCIKQCLITQPVLCFHLAYWVAAVDGLTPSFSQAAMTAARLPSSSANSQTRAVLLPGRGRFGDVIGLSLTFFSSPGISLGCGSGAGKSRPSFSRSSLTGVVSIGRLLMIASALVIRECFGGSSPPL